jgi:hypothetical protein
MPFGTIVFVPSRRRALSDLACAIFFCVGAKDNFLLYIFDLSFFNVVVGHIERWPVLCVRMTSDLFKDQPENKNVKFGYILAL